MLAQGKDSGATFVYTDESCADTVKSVSAEMGTVKVNVGVQISGVVSLPVYLNQFQRDIVRQNLNLYCVVQYADTK